jgi:hypothetical protein
MANREAGCEMGDECNWVRSLASGVEPFGITITKAILNNGTSTISVTRPEYPAPHMIWGHDKPLVSSRSIYQHQLPYHLTLVYIVNISKQAPWFPHHSRLPVLALHKPLLDWTASKTSGYTQNSPTFSLYNILNSPIFVSFRYRHKETGPLTY